MANQRMILVAEDDPTDAFFLQRAFGKTWMPVGLKFVRDGQEAIDYLRGEPPFGDRLAHPLPQLLLLDLKMPRLNGFEVLHWLKTQPGLKRLLVIVFSSSAETGDINRAYDLGANSYLVKPHATEQLLELVNRVEQYWLEANQNPNFLAV
jgi:CheY-like chemotaxis protein